MTLDVTLVVAAADNGVIGRDNALPWRLPSDMRRFKALTFGKPVVMGRKTFRSIGRPLPGRTNIVITRDTNFRARGIVAATSVEEAMDVARGDALRRGTDAIAVIGGAEIYALAMSRATRIELTRVHATPQGDARVELPDLRAWQEIARERHAAADGDSADFTCVTYRRIAAD